MKIITKGLRIIFALLDSAIYGLIERAFQLILDLSNVEIFSNTAISNFARRLYIILGLVMIFKLMISFIQIIVNPDKMDDKEQGVGNVLKRVVISLALIVMVPSIFDLARQVQSYILPVIPRVVLGANINPDISDPDTQEKMDKTGRMMAFYSFLPFFGYDNPTCDDGSIIGTGTSEVGGNNVEIYSVTTARNHINDEDSCSTDEHGFKYSYRLLMSTIVGAYELFVLVQIAVEIAIRAIKLGICEFVAPIPIASYIDPKTSKQTFDNWVSTTLKTYADLFIRILLLYFVIFVFMTVFDDSTMTTLTAKLGGDGWRKTFVILFIIVGLLQFIKQAPKFLQDLLGFKGDGNLMGMFKGEGYKAFKEAAGIPGTFAAAAGSGIGNARYAWKNGDKKRAFLRGLGGVGGALKRGTAATLKGEGWSGAYGNNIKATTGISQRRVNANFMARKSKEEYEAAKRTIMANASLTQDEKEEQIKRLPRPIQPMRDKFRNAVDRFQGFTPISGGSYTSAASTLSNWREKYFTGEAMKKLDEEGSKLDSITHKYKDDAGNDIDLNYSQVRKAYDELMNGNYKGKINGHAVDASRVRELFSAAQKHGAIDYINAAINHQYDVKNTTIDEMDKQIRGMIDGLGIEAGLKNKLLDDYRADPGKFFKELSDITKRLETSGARRSSYEENQEKK